MNIDQVNVLAGFLRNQ